MALIERLRRILNDTPGTATDLDYNYQAVQGYLDADVVQVDGAVAMTGPLTLPGEGTAANHAVTVSQLGVEGARLDAIEANDWVTTARIADDAVTAAEIATDAVTTAKIATGAVGTNEIEDASIVGSDLAVNTLTFREIGPDAVREFELADDAVVTAKIDNDAVTEAKLDSAVLSSSESSGAALNGWGGTVYYKKVGNIVYFSYDRPSFGASASSSTLFTLPSGFRPGRQVQFAGIEHTTASNGVGVRVRVSTGGVITVDPTNSLVSFQGFAVT